MQRYDTERWKKDVKKQKKEYELKSVGWLVGVVICAYKLYDAVFRIGARAQADYDCEVVVDIYDAFDNEMRKGDQ